MDFIKFKEHNDISTRTSNYMDNLNVLLHLFEQEEKNIFINFAGITFNNGLFRIHDSTTFFKAKALIREFYGIECLPFGFDWLGRQFCKQSNKILMFDPSDGQYYKIEDLTITDFLETDLCEHKDDTLNVTYFEKWQSNRSESLSFDECVGYKIPLFLGGEESVSNMEVVDIEMYWDINLQIYQSVK